MYSEDRDLVIPVAIRLASITMLLVLVFGAAAWLDTRANDQGSPSILPARVVAGTHCEVHATCVSFAVTDTDVRPFVGPQQDSDPLHVIETTTVIMRDETEGGVQSTGFPLSNTNLITTSLGFVPRGAVQEVQGPTSILTVYPVVVEDSGGDRYLVPNTYEVTTYEIEHDDKGIQGARYSHDHNLD